MNLKLPPPIRIHSIQGRLTAIALFFIVATAVAMGVAGFRLTVHFEHQRYRDHFGLLASYLASNAELGVLLGNEKILEQLTENMLAVSDVQRVEILDRSGRVIIRSSRDNPPAGLGSVAAPVVASSLEGRDAPFLAPDKAEEVVGQVVVSYSLAGLDQLKKELAFRFVLVSLGLALAPVLMYWLLARAITAPLLGLLAVAGQVSRGRLDVRARGGSLAEIDTLATAINEMLDAIESQRRKLGEAHAAMARQQVLAEVGKFSMIVAHEIKNPLAIIKGSLEVLRKEGPMDAGMKAQLMVFLDEEIERINKLIEDFLLFARPQEPTLQAMTAAGVVASLAQRMRLLSSVIAISGDDQVEPDLALRCDPHLLERALLNIVRNGLEASPDGSGVAVTIAGSDRRLVFTVRDNGPGIPEEALPRLFEPFFSTKAKGTGLGLAIAKEIINAHGGNISATNPKGGGACFTISLPVEEMKG
ncbi:MAG: ATP-binding protein [Thermodesulfobacteriota bacterium]